MMAAIDLHCDTLTRLTSRGGLRRGGAQVTLEGLLQGGVALQCFADFVPTGLFPRPCRKAMSRIVFDRLYGRYKALLRRHPGVLYPVLAASDLDRLGEPGRIGVLLALEDGGAMGGRLEDIERFFNRGVRLVTLTWNHPNALGFPNSADPALMEKGLTEYGFEAVEEMERLGIVVDVSHVSDGVFRDVARVARRPFVASHSNSRAVCPHPRNLSDAMIRTLADKGGVMGLNLYGAFLSPGGGASRIEDMVRHVLHIRQAGGDGVLALGGDFDGMGRGRFEVAGPQDWPRLGRALRKAGLSSSQLERMWRLNAEAALREALPRA